MVEKARGTGGIFNSSLYCDVIFANILNKSGDLSEEEFNLYMDLSNNMFRHLEEPKLIIYLEIDVENATKKIRERGRDYEQIVLRDYWESLNSHYREYFNSYSGEVLKINVDDLDFRDKKEDREYILKLIKKRLQKI